MPLHAFTAATCLSVIDDFERPIRWLFFSKRPSLFFHPPTNCDKWHHVISKNTIQLIINVSGFYSQSSLTINISACLKYELAIDNYAQNKSDTFSKLNNLVIIASICTWFVWVYEIGKFVLNSICLFKHHLKHGRLLMTYF